MSVRLFTRRRNIHRLKLHGQQCREMTSFSLAILRGGSNGKERATGKSARSADERRERDKQTEAKELAADVSCCLSTDNRRFRHATGNWLAVAYGSSRGVHQWSAPIVVSWTVA
jgi:hypothetical protein